MNEKMRTIEKVLFGSVLGAIFPILGFIAAWWGTFAFLPGGPFLFTALTGLAIGIIVDVVYLRRWVNKAYSINLKTWMAVYIFYSIGMLGFFMGVPVFNVILAVPAGMFIGGRLARQNADPEEKRRMKWNTCTFTACVLAFVCAISALIALVDPFTGNDLQSMLGLHFKVTRSMLIGVITIGGTSLMLLQWMITGKMIKRTYALMRTNASALR